eukprot:9156067-Ditylum_brightwellii.AAC.1
MIKAAKETLKTTEKTSDILNDYVLLSIELNGICGKENKCLCKYNIKGEENIVTQIRPKVLGNLESCTEASQDLLNKCLETYKIKGIYDIEWHTNIDAQNPKHTKKNLEKKPLNSIGKQ